ncbi:hypothetical protein [Hymenobacter jeollabukensis]|uniref:hypothetical protein n=1 Tax=Hymenobacter jeollabukensis TaxID=2025313 RepID=UPI001484D399|nr:hypothetical protein [Hymenobacter jeollabukensis]
MQLARFSPAEILILQRMAQAPVRHMLRLTFADLVLRDVLRLENRPFQASPYDPPAPCYYVRPGDAWLAHRPRPHELPLLQVLPEARQMILLRHYVGVLLEELPAPPNFRQLVTEAPGLQGCVRRNGWHKLVQSFALTDQGIDLGIILRQETEALMAQVAAGDPDMVQLLPPLYGSALLAGMAPPPELHLFDQELLRALRAQREQRFSSSDWAAGIGGCGGHSSSDGSDSPGGGGADFGGGHSGGGGASGDFGGDSGCSSGCSGCSGSGCGGCGGD